MSRELDGGHLRVGHRDPGGIAPAIELRADMQPARLCVEPMRLTMVLTSSRGVPRQCMAMRRW